MDQFIVYGKDSNLSVNIILDYEDIECPCAVYKGSKLDIEILKIRTVRQIITYGTTACPLF